MTTQHQTRSDNDLEKIVTCLEVSAIILTERPDQPFTRDALVDGAVDLYPALDRRVVLETSRRMGRTFRALKGGQLCLR